MKISCDYSHVILLQKFNYNRKNELSLQDQFSIFPAYEDHGLETGSSPDVVAKVVLKVVTSENPDLRYFAGNDIETVIEAKRNMSDEEFYKMMKQRWRV